MSIKFVALDVDAQGFAYAVELGGGANEQLTTIDLGAGEKVKGWLVFEIPADATPASIKYFLGVFEEDFLQAGPE